MDETASRSRRRWPMFPAARAIRGILRLITDCHPSTPAKLAAVTILAWMTAGCEVSYVSSQPIATAALEERLVVGRSTEDDVVAALRQPDGIGRYLSPFEDEPRVMWVYNYEAGVVPRFTTRTMLFVLFRNGVYDGYIWFSDDLIMRQI